VTYAHRLVTPPCDAAPPVRQIRTFHPRRGRLSGRRLDALERLWPGYGATITDGPAAITLDTARLFGREAPVVLEIGSGMGEATTEMAAADPARNYLAVDVHTPGIANLLALVEERGLDNVRVLNGDALELVRHHLAPGSLDAVHAFFPDPWPKVRHHKRRLIQPAHVALLASRLVTGGVLHCATDCADYAKAMLTALSAEPSLTNTHDRYAPRPGYRPSTKFEQRGLEAGRPVFDLIFKRGPS
jgi:tRNA (guanine-N7-)-methyltransferase